MPDDREGDHEPYWDEESQRYLHWDALIGRWIPLTTPPVVPEPQWDEESQRYEHWDAPPGLRAASGCTGWD
jgi:hypothetical protein